MIPCFHHNYNQCQNSSNEYYDCQGCRPSHVEEGMGERRRIIISGTKDTVRMHVLGSGVGRDIGYITATLELLNRERMRTCRGGARDNTVH